MKIREHVHHTAPNGGPTPGGRIAHYGGSLDGQIAVVVPPPTSSAAGIVPDLTVGDHVAAFAESHRPLPD